VKYDIWCSIQKTEQSFFASVLCRTVKKEMCKRQRDAPVQVCKCYTRFRLMLETEWAPLQSAPYLYVCVLALAYLSSRSSESGALPR
jgi:hypothetical protein